VQKWQNFARHIGSRGPTAVAELLAQLTMARGRRLVFSFCSTERCNQMSCCRKDATRGSRRARTKTEDRGDRPQSPLNVARSPARLLCAFCTCLAALRRLLRFVSLDTVDKEARPLTPLEICIFNNNSNRHTHTHTRLTALFRDYPGDSVPER